MVREKNVCVSRGGRGWSTLAASLAALLTFAFAACSVPAGPLGGGLAGETASRAVVPAKGAADTLDIASWNIEWMGSPSYAPTDDNLQRQNATSVISGADMDIWGFCEIVDLTQFNAMKAALPGYAGFLANDPLVLNGAAYYSDFSNTEQKVGILYKSALASLVDARIILTQYDTDFAGRPPMQVTLNVNLNGRSETVVVIVQHAKAGSDATSWQRRVNASTALKSYIDSTYPTQKVWVIGDYNDDVDTSIAVGYASPYQNFVGDAARYLFPTKALSDAGIASTTTYSDMIDHHLVTNEAASTLVPGSAEVYRVDQFIANYDATTSDHYPVLSRYSWAAGAPTLVLTAPNGGESWASGSSHAITWTSSGVANLRLEYSADGGSTWSQIVSSVAASPGSYQWTLPSVTTGNARVRATDTGSSLSDASNASFSITASSSPAQVILNEICANEPGSDTAGEFVEIVNIGGTAADIGGWTIRDASAVRHTFPAGTILASGKALVVFAGSSAIPAGLGNAVAASTGTLNLSNSGDTVSLRNSAGTTIQSYTYSSSLASSDGVSMNRSPDGSATGSFVKHNSLSSLPRSAGTRATGAAW